MGPSSEERNLNNVITKYKLTTGKEYDILISDSWHVVTDDGVRWNIGKAMTMFYFKPLSEIRDKKLVELGI